MISILMAVAIVQSAAREELTADHQDMLADVSGDWKVFDDETGKVAQDCAHAQSFQVSPDQTEIVLTEPWSNFTAHYRIIYREPLRILAFIDGEKRQTESGDPVLWWFYRESADSFRFRRYDWPKQAATTVQWQRCKPK